jgi:circadian clock protein KaiC
MTKRKSAASRAVTSHRKKQISKSRSGIPGFEEISKGGIPTGRTTLVSGTSGSGKTIFATQFLYSGIVDYNEPGVFVTFEESPKDIMRNMEGFGWKLKDLLKKKKLVFVDASPSPAESSEFLKSGSYDLSAFVARINHAIKKVKAKRIIIDSISALFPRYEDAPIIRKTLYQLSAQLKLLGVTALLTAERPVEGEEIARFGVEEFVSDNVILLHNRLIKSGDRERTIEILKFRGADHEKVESPLIVSYEGMEIFPRPKPLLTGKGFTKKLSTGIPGLDKIMHGGMYKNSTTLLTGASGTGKTVSALHFVMEGAKRGEKCIMIEFEESPEQLYRNAKSFGWNLKKYVDKGIVRLICHYPEDLKPEQYTKLIQKHVLDTKPDRLVLDSLSALQRIYAPAKFREFVIGLNAFLKVHDVTSLLTNTTAELLGFSKITETHLSTTTDNIIVLKYVELESRMGRVLSVLKMRGGGHEKGLANFEVNKHGVEVLGMYENVQGLLTGSAVYTKPPVDVVGVMSRLDALRRKLLDKKISQKKYDIAVKKIKKDIEAIQAQGF